MSAISMGKMSRARARYSRSMTAGGASPFLRQRATTGSSASSTPKVTFGTTSATFRSDRPSTQSVPAALP